MLTYMKFQFAMRGISLRTCIPGLQRLYLTIHPGVYAQIFGVGIGIIQIERAQSFMLGEECMGLHKISLGSNLYRSAWDLHKTSLRGQHLCTVKILAYSLTSILSF